MAASSSVSSFTSLSGNGLQPLVFKYQGKTWAQDIEMSEASSSSGPWEELPEEIVKLWIDSGCDPNALNAGTLRLVCRRWAELIDQGSARLVKLRDAPPKNWCPTKWPNLQSLDLNIAFGCKTMTSTSVYSSPGVWEGLGGYDETNEWSSHTDYVLPTAHEDDTQMLSSVDEVLEDVKSVTALRTLNLRECLQLSNDGIRSLCALTQLTSLDMSWCTGVTEPGILCLRSLLHLTSLDMSCTNVTHTSLAAVWELPALQSLQIRNCQGITDDVLEGLGENRSIATLGLGMCHQVSDAGIKAVAKKGRAILSLDLSNTSMTEASVRWLLRMGSLKFLDVSCCSQLSERGLGALCRAFGSEAATNDDGDSSHNVRVER